MALTDKLSAIGVAIRAKTGKSDLLTLDQMPTEIASISGGSDPVIESLEITANGTYTATDCDGYSPITVSVPQDGAPTDEELTFSGDQSYTFQYGKFDWLVEKYGDRITTSNIGSAQRMFAGSQLTSIPFDFNFRGAGTTSYKNILKEMFTSAGITVVPKLKNARPEADDGLFNGCLDLVHIPDDFYENFDWSYMETQTGAYSGPRNGVFSGCWKLRSFPMEYLNHGNPNLTYSYSIYNSAFNDCMALDEVVGLPFPHINATWTSNALGYTISKCHRLKRFTFATQEDGSPYVVKWKNQTLSFSGVGWVVNEVNKNSLGIPLSKAVTDDATYQALKDDPDWFSLRTAYSRYNHDSAVETINSLPDTSAYLATAGGTNTIKFYGTSGESTDGGACSNLTEEEIAVATAKGWTVTFM